MNVKKKSNNQNYFNYLFALIILIVGFAVGYAANDPAPMKSATAKEIEQAKNQIADLYKDKTVDACWQVNDGPNLAVGRYELTYRNLRINKSANRAIITDCSDFDTLLAKDKSGEWIQTNVNLQIGNRVNPEWQKECGIEDITVADEVVRPENSSIDQMNLEECRQLNQQ